MERIEGRRPNVVLITTDQQRYDSIGINGSSFMTTPNMDTIGREGAVFRRAYCPNTVCTPSRVSIMTGQHLSRHGSYNIGTRPTWEGRFLSDILRSNGYRTHHIGKAHWHPWGADSPETREPDAEGRPFADFAGFETAELSVGHGNWGIKGHYAAWIKRKGHDPGGFAVKPVLANDFNETGEWELPVELHSGTWAAERAEQFIREHARGLSEQPFYLNIGFQDPHHPHVLPYNYGNRINPADIPLPDIDVTDEQGAPPHVPLFRSGTLVESRFNGRFVIAGNGRGSAWGPYFQDEHKARTTRAYYYSMVQLIDEQLGRIMAALDETGLAEDTLLIFTSDHGEMLGDHGIGQKGPLFYEGVTHIPLLMRYPRGFAPCTVNDCVSLVDLLPTILDFAGISDDVRRDGVSLKERLQQGAHLGRDGVRIEYKEEPDRIRFKAWVTERWKMAVYPGESFGELYDLQNDPGEKRNLFDDPAFSVVKNELFAAMVGDMERSEPVNSRPSRV